MKQILGIFGPTASGKSGIAERLAATKKYKIINADSQQIYKGLDILAAVDSKPEYALYAFLDSKKSDANFNSKDNSSLSHKVDDKFTVMNWAKLALQEIEQALSDGLIPVLVGGTGLYFKCMQSGLANLPKIDAKIIEQIEEYSIAQLKEMLPENIANKFHDRRRLMKAVGIFLQTNKHIDYFFEQPVQKLHDYDFSIFAIIPKKEIIWERIENRLNTIFPDVFNEVSVFNSESDVIGLKEIREFLNEQLKNIVFEKENNKLHWNIAMQSLEFANLKKNLLFKTRQYAKRQRTFANSLDIEKLFENGQDLFEYILSR